MSVAVVLFTRDLRVHDNPTLAEAVRAADQVVPLFVLDEGILEWERRGYPFVAAPGTPLPPLERGSPGSSSR